ncbi:hypothetical protein BpHYR1_042206 [Brachionus plicatilis]|uniref:Uncharacterized protein n=1 Tax=Brachionus plicatilis TaxID=10195 RepID=A0A3M7SGJ0_BRAPC|nr:hypothetical protein BpHYR1_042206 [Brachionus plicatilis]
MSTSTTGGHGTTTNRTRWPHLAAGPLGIMLATTTVGSIEPHPDSTMTTPKGSFLCFGTITSF